MQEFCVVVFVTLLWRSSKKIIAAALCSGIAWYVLEQTELASLTKAIVYGVIGVVSPELINGLIKLGARFAKNPTKFFDDNKSN